MKFVYVFLLVLSLSSCKENRIVQMSFEKDNVTITYAGSSSTLDYTISCGDIILYSEKVNVDNKGTYFLPLLAKKTVIEKVDSLAYWITKKGEFKVNFAIRQDLIILADSIQNYTYDSSKHIISNPIYVKLLSEKLGAIKWNDYSQYNRRAKTFLVEHNERVNKSFIEQMAYNIYILLNYGQENQYSLKDVSVVNELPQKSIVLSTNMDSKYFYLIAIKDEEEIKEFVKTEIVDDFKKGKLNQQKGDKQLQLPLIKPGYSNGLLYIFLLGIDEDWNYDYHFVGGVMLDNIGPFIEWKSYMNTILNRAENQAFNFYENVKFKDYYIKCEDFFLANSSIRNVTWGDFEGNNYWGYPITLSINFSKVGDIDHLILQGKKYDIKMNKISNLWGTNPCFRFEHRFPRLNIGDNYIDIKFVDELGNVSIGIINIATESIRDDGIEISNNIYNDIN